MSFSTEDLALLDAAQEVEIETQAPERDARWTTIWLVIDDGVTMNTPPLLGTTLRLEPA